ncbi:MAG: serine/threonine-protein kinase [Chloracidobacterium sp.]
MATDLSNDRWMQVNEILQQAIDLDPPARRPFIIHACGNRPSLCREVLALLDAYESDEAGWRFSDSPLFGYALRAMASRQAASWIGAKVGDYRLVRELGMGGMGTVYLGVRDDAAFEKEVAIKIVHQFASNSDFLQRRLQRERAILARLEHPNIARLLDGGTTDNGLPFFVMEYVPGVPLTTYGEQHRLTLRQRLEMFQSVCAAIHYAHQNLVIHRDLKPGNILVTDDGVPKLIDFGIAKLLDEQAQASEPRTATVQRAMTLPYASPEQVRGEPVTTVSDVYSLGVVLYEWLTGCLPFQTTEGSPSLEYLIQHAEPLPPSVAVRKPASPRKQATDAPPETQATEDRMARSRELAGDLDAIILRAMHKDPTARYASAEQFSSDIERYLQGWPVLARGASARYRLRKFLRRHRVTVALSLASIVALSGATTVSLRQAHLARQAQARAEQQFQETWQLARSNVFELHDAIQRLPGSTGARGLLVEQTLGYLDRLSRESGTDAMFHRELGRAYIRVGEVQGRPYTANLGDVNGALKSYQTGLMWLERACQAHPTQVECQRELSIGHERIAELMMYRLGNFPVARHHLDRAQALCETLTKAQPSDPEIRYLRATLSIAWGDWYHMQSDLSAALGWFEQARQQLERLVADMPAAVAYRRTFAGALQRKVYCLMSLGRQAENSGFASEAQMVYARALPLHRQALALRRSLATTNPVPVECRRSVLDSLVDEADLAGRLKQYPTARIQFEEVFKQFQALVTEDTTNRELLFDMASLLSRFSMLEEAAGRPDLALVQWQRIETCLQKIQAAGCSGREVDNLSLSVPSNFIRLAVPCRRPSLARAAARRLEAELVKLPDDTQRAHYWYVLLMAYQYLGEKRAAEAVKSSLMQWLARAEADPVSSATLYAAAEIYLDKQALGLTNPPKLLALARRFRAQEGTESLNHKPLLIQALIRTGNTAEASQHRQAYLNMLKKLFQDSHL